MSAIGLAARLARREVRRRPGRTVLVATMVALPVAGMVLSLVLLRTDQLSPDDEWQRDHGDADAVLFPSGPDGTELDTTWLPPGSRTLVTEMMWTRARTAAGDRSELAVHGFAADDPMVDGLIDLVAGRLPTAGDEVALAPEVADDLRVGVGDRLVLARPEIELRVVGLVEDPAALHDPVALVAPGGALLDADPRNTAMPLGLVDLPVGVSLDAAAGERPVMLRSDAGDEPSGAATGVPWIHVIGAVVLTVIGIVISAAFAAGARRQLVMLGQLSASGAPGPVLRAMLVLQGTVTGLVGAIAGVAIAAGTLAAARSALEQLVGHRFGAYDVQFVDVGGPVLIGVAAATVAALIPAWSVARIPTLAALAGRRPLPPVRYRFTVAGGVAVAVGVALLGLAVLGSATGEDTEIWALVAIVGGVLELLGACAIAPAVVAHLEPLAGLTRGAWRLAARSLARQRARTGAVVSAVAAAAGLAVGATALVMGAEAGEAADPELSDRVVVASEFAFVTEDVTGARPSEVPAVPDAAPKTGDVTGAPAIEAPAVPDAAAQAELARILPGADRVTLRTAGDQTDWPDVRVPIVADEEVLDAFGFGDDVRSRLDDAGLVAIDIGDEAPAQVTLPDGTVQPLATVASERSFGSMWGILVSPALLDDLGVDPHDAALAYVSERPLSSEQVDEVEALRDDWQFGAAPGEESFLEVSVRWPEEGPTPVQVELILTGLAVLFAVLVVGVSLALAAAESRDERDVLTVAGAGPGSLARSAGAKAWLLAGIGAAMAVPIGLLPASVFVTADDGDMQFVVPWRTIGLLVVALPVVVAAVAWATSATAQRLRPVRVSTAVFE
jgi:putative ABC transport system permease protein